MSGIMIAMWYCQGTTQWSDWVHAVDTEQERSTVRACLPTWRDGGVPEVYPGQRCYLVFNQQIHGFAPVVGLPVQVDDKTFEIDLDASQWQPCGLEWAWKHHYRHSWRYVRFTWACLLDFPNWRLPWAAPAGQFGTAYYKDHEREHREIAASAGGGVAVRSH